MLYSLNGPLSNKILALGIKSKKSLKNSLTLKMVVLKYSQLNKQVQFRD
ncbi:hypothetical protein AM1_B0227 (plasmid) [Acaryochloris marina MBIC11017]|uniref:Uncharacterized protein n=1 Tax=Acaryochloris marina (strain MBIC 11017) TaxID=329726 RepID=A8ZLC0_ACAM1|nr:hypothetical protein AM1_B0227 [Acaryochloris marina MBIC11017]